MINKIYIWTSPLPLLLFWVLSIDVNRQEGMGQWAASQALVVPFFLSIGMGVIGLALIVVAKKKKEPVANLWFSTLMAGSIILYVLARGAILQFSEFFG
jgi:hypothetical protein